MVKQIEKMPTLGNGTVFEAADFKIIHKNIANVQKNAFSTGFIFSYHIIFIRMAEKLVFMP